MEIKGVAVKSIPDFVKKKYPGYYSEWINSLSPASRALFQNGIVSNKWYSVNEAAIDPTEKIGTLFFNQDIKTAAWESGKYSAESALTGVYKLYVRLSSPGHIISRASRIFSAYYNPAEISTKNVQSDSVEVHMTKFNPPSEIIEYRIGGWIEKALELSGCKAVDVKIDKSLAKGDPVTLYKINWS
jgi:hypothetical protein